MAANHDSGVRVGESNLRAACAALSLALLIGTPTGALAQAYAGSTHQAGARQLRGADETYKFLAPLENQYAGDADYDYAFGTAALDSGRQSHAVFVLQRAVAARPRFAGARMELARAYYAIGDYESARREFAILEKDNPPPQARRAIADYVAAIDRHAAAYRRHRAAWAELGTGFDSNANGAPDIQEFIGIPLDSRNQSTSSSYYSLGAGGLISQPFAPGWRVVGNGSAAYRGNPDASFVDSQVLRLAGGVDWRSGRAELSLQPNFAMAMLDGEDNHQVVGVDLTGIWHADRVRAAATVRNAQTRYAEGLEVLDVDTLLLGLEVQYATPALPRVRWQGALTFGGDDAVEPGSPYGRDLLGARLGAAFDLGRGHAMFASLAMVTADYDGQFFVPGGREDDQAAAMLGYEWSGLRARGLALRAQLNYVDNSSTVLLYDYDRFEAGVSLRKEFR